jgi:hypothetical protein
MQSGRAWKPIPIRGATDKILILAFKRVQEHQNRPRNEGDMVKTILDSLLLPDHVDSGPKVPQHLLKANMVSIYITIHCRHKRWG